MPNIDITVKINTLTRNRYSPRSFNVLYYVQCSYQDEYCWSIVVFLQVITHMIALSIFAHNVCVLNVECMWRYAMWMCYSYIYFFLIRPLLTLFYNVKSFQLTQNEKFVKGSLAHCKWFAVISFWVLESNVCSNCSFPFKMTIDRLVNMCIGME